MRTAGQPCSADGYSFGDVIVVGRPETDRSKPASPSRIRARGVRSRAGYFDPGLGNEERRGSRDSRRANRLVRRQSAEKHMPIGRRWSRVLQVIDERCTHGGRQWVSRRIAGLAVTYFNAVIAPIDVIELKRGDFARA